MLYIKNNLIKTIFRKQTERKVKYVVLLKYIKKAVHETYNAIIYCLVNKSI